MTLSCQLVVESLTPSIIISFRTATGCILSRGERLSSLPVVRSSFSSYPSNSSSLISSSGIGTPNIESATFNEYLGTRDIALRLKGAGLLGRAKLLHYAEMVLAPNH